VARQFQHSPARREKVPLLVGLVGPSGSGKTYSALELATGIQSVVGGKIFFIDSEAKRALHYADKFDFQHVPLSQPFGSLDYLDALRYCNNNGAGVTIVDSMSHEHEGAGGMLDLHEEILQRMAGDDGAKRERMKMLAWAKPKQLRRELINGLLQLGGNFIFCFRAKESSKPVKAPGGKTIVEKVGFVPIAGDEFTYEMTANILLYPQSNGYPTWESDLVGERATMKLPEQFRGMFANGQQLSRSVGEAMARWAQGEPGKAPVEPTNEGLIAEAEQMASFGTAALEQWWKLLDKVKKRALETQKDALKAAAKQADSELGDMFGDRFDPANNPIK